MNFDNLPQPLPAAWKTSNVFFTREINHFEGLKPGLSCCRGKNPYLGASKSSMLGGQTVSKLFHTDAILPKSFRVRYPLHVILRGGNLKPAKISLVTKTLSKHKIKMIKRRSELIWPKNTIQDSKLRRRRSRKIAIWEGARGPDPLPNPPWG